MYLCILSYLYIYLTTYVCAQILNHLMIFYGTYNEIYTTGDHS